MHNILLISGSLRRDSLNTQLLQAITGLADNTLKFDWYQSLADLPMYNQDQDHDKPHPEVTKLKNAIAHADGLIIASPEYNHGIPGVLKNAIDWASRPHGKSPLSGKCIAIFVATPGRAFGFNGLDQLRNLLWSMGNFVVCGPQVVLHEAQKKLQKDKHGTTTLIDPVAADLIQGQLYGLTHAIEHKAGDIVFAPFTHAQKELKKQALNASVALPE